MKLIMISCRKATELIEKKQVVGLTPLERIRLNIHSSMCETCKQWEKQSQFLDKSLNRFINKSESLQNGEALTEEKKQSIKDSLKN